MVNARMWLIDYEFLFAWQIYDFGDKKIATKDFFFQKFKEN